MTPKRLQIPNLGTFYTDLLIVDAATNNRSAPMQAQSLLCAKLQEREKIIRERVKYISDRDGIPIDSVWSGLLSGTYVFKNGGTFEEEKTEP